MNWKEFFKPNKWKLIYASIPFMFFFLFLIFGWISNSLYDSFPHKVGILEQTTGIISIIFVFLFYIISIPLQPLLKVLGMTSSGGWFTNVTISGHIVVVVFYALIIYLIESLVQYKKKK